jgi:hypothetical protein
MPPFEIAEAGNPGLKSECRMPNAERSSKPEITMPSPAIGHRNHRVARSVLDCGGPPPLFFRHTTVATRLALPERANGSLLMVTMETDPILPMRDQNPDDTIGFTRLNALRPIDGIAAKVNGNQ